jgi:hypothetical protein
MNSCTCLRECTSGLQDTEEGSVFTGGETEVDADALSFEAVIPRERVKSEGRIHRIYESTRTESSMELDGYRGLCPLSSFSFFILSEWTPKPVINTELICGLLFHGDRLKGRIPFSISYFLIRVRLAKLRFIAIGTYLDYLVNYIWLRKTFLRLIVCHTHERKPKHLIRWFSWRFNWQAKEFREFHKICWLLVPVNWPSSAGPPHNTY